MWIFILVAVIAVLLILYIKFYNRLRRLSVKVQEGSAGIDVALEKRYDMLSEEIEAVKKYLAHEYQIYTEVTSTRAGKELNESIFQEKKQLSEEAVKAISETITEQQKQMETIRQQLEQQRGQDHSFGAETPGMGLSLIHIFAKDFRDFFTISEGLGHFPTSKKSPPFSVEKAGILRKRVLFSYDCFLLGTL